MIQAQLSLIRRELWEHRNLYVVPAVLGIIISLLAVTGQVAVSAFGEAVDIAIIGATNLGENERGAAITALMFAMSVVFALALGILVIFYALDSLYTERKDRSILFWRSLPVTDAETVVSKLITAVFVIPLITFGVIVATHIIVLAISSVWVGMKGASAWHLIWSAAPFFDNWTATLVVLVAFTLWMSPFVGWLLFVSAFAKRSPFLTAFLPIIVLPMLEKIFLRSSVFAETVLDRSSQIPIFRGIEASALIDDIESKSITESGISWWSLLDVQGFIVSPALWIGLIVCGLFAAAAVYVRRYRDET